MLNLELQVTPQTEERLKKILGYTPDQETFAQNIIAYQITELRRATLNIRLELEAFEARFGMSTADFYCDFKRGNLPDSEDFMVWAGLYEMLSQNQQRLQELE